MTQPLEISKEAREAAEALVQNLAAHVSDNPGLSLESKLQIVREAFQTALTTAKQEARKQVVEMFRKKLPVAQGFVCAEIADELEK